MRMPPDPNGHGGSQRAWHLVEALRQAGDVHFVLVFRDDDHDCINTPLAALEPLVKSVTRINIGGWRGFDGRQFGIFHPGLFEFVKMRSAEAPKLRRQELTGIAAQLPVTSVDMIFAGRLCCAVILQSLIDLKLVSGTCKIVDFDDLMSKFRRLQLQNAGASLGRQGRLMAQLDVRLIARAERRIAETWHGASVCTDEDVSALLRMAPLAEVAKIPNVVERPLLPPRAPDGKFRILFIGNLGFAANSEGLTRFIDDAWPRLLQLCPQAELTIVGINPDARIAALAQTHGIALARDVPEVEPYYRACDAVIVPILFGSGTRIKILEAMAYGRAVVSTPVGAEGMGLEQDVHLLLAASIAQFAEVLTRLANDPELRQRLTLAAREFQQRNFAKSALASALARLIAASRLRATPSSSAVR